MHSYTTSRAVQQERYLRQAKERQLRTADSTDSRRLRRLLAMMARYRSGSGALMRKRSETPSRVGLLTVGAVMAFGAGFGAASWPESPASEVRSSIGDRAAETHLAQHSAKVAFLTEQYEARDGDDPLRQGPKSPLTAE